MTTTESTFQARNGQLFSVQIIARERDHESRILETHTFKTLAAAQRFARKWNRKHCPPRSIDDIPDYYEAAYVQ